jgi:hypothetical protein
MSVPICQHVKVDGTLCQVPPLDGQHYCHFHLEGLGRRLRMARARARREPYHLVLPILEDLNSVLVARQQVMDALNAGHIDAKHAGVLLYGLQGIASDLRSANAPRLGVYDPAIDTAPRATDYPNFEAKYDLPPDIDLGKPPEVVFPPPADTPRAASAPLDPEAAQGLERQQKYPMVTPTEVELEHLRQEDSKAYQRRLRELARAEDLRWEREQRKLVQARYMVEADGRNQATEQRMVADFQAWEEQQYGPRKPEVAESAQGEPQAAAAGEAPKKPSAADPGEPADSEAAHKEEIARSIAALEQRLRAQS